MIGGAISEDAISQLTIAILATFASFSIFRAVLFIPHYNRMPWATLATVCFFMAGTYWFDFFNWVDPTVTRDWRRGIGYVLFSSMVWAAEGTVKFWKNQSIEVARLLDDN